MAMITSQFGESIYNYIDHHRKDKDPKINEKIRRFLRLIVNSFDHIINLLKIYFSKFFQLFRLKLKEICT